METFNTHEAKTHLSRLLERAAKGERFIIAKSGKPIAILMGFHAQGAKRVGGQWKGRVRISPNFDDALPPEVERAFRDPS